MRRKLLRGAGAAIFWLLLWELLALAVGKELLLPAPLTVLRRLLELLPSAQFWRMTGMSLLRVVCGVICAVALGTALAAGICRFRWLDALAEPLLTVVKSTPVASFIILALVWMGRDILPAFIALLIVLPVVTEGVATGIRQTDPDLLEVARVFRFPKVKMLSRVYAPAVLPYFRSACRGSLGMGWKAGIAAEVLTVPRVSIGKQLYESKLYLQTADLFAWTLVVIVCSLVIEKALTALLDRREGGHGDNHSSLGRGNSLW